MSQEAPKIYLSENGSKERLINREDPDWKRLHGNHIRHLTKTNPGRTPEGEVITEEWLEIEASQMADVQFRQLLEMRRKEKELNDKKKAESELTLEDREELVKQAKSGNIFAAHALEEIFDEKNKN